MMKGKGGQWLPAALLAAFLLLFSFMAGLALCRCG